MLNSDNTYADFIKNRGMRKDKNPVEYKNIKRRIWMIWWQD